MSWSFFFICVWWETEFVFRLITYETAFTLRFKEQDVIFYGTEYEIRFTHLGNGLHKPFRKNLIFCRKWNTNSVSQNCETDSVIRFIKKIANFFLKRITESVSQFCETKFVFRFVQNYNFSKTGYIIRFLEVWNGICNPIPCVFFSNGFWDPFALSLNVF